MSEDNSTHASMHTQSPNTPDQNTDTMEIEVTDTGVKDTDVLLNNTDLTSLLTSYLDGKNARIKLNQNGAQVLRTVIQRLPSIIDDIGSHILAIVSDNVIDMNDLPTFILLVKDIININVKDLKKIKVTRGDIVDMIESIMFILIDTNMIKTGDNKDSFLALLKLSMQILDASVNLDKTISCFSCC